MPEAIDIKGQKFGKLTVLEKLPNKEGIRGTLWRCRCDCGKETIAIGTSLRKGDKKSCGCLRNTRGAASERCEYCGQELVYTQKRYCSQTCAARHRRGVKLVDVDMGHAWVELADRRWRCRYQETVSCVDRDCENCGWNPSVAKARSKRIMEQRKAEEA